MNETAAVQKQDIDHLRQAVEQQTGAMLELVRVARNQNEQFEKLVEVVQQMVLLQREMNRDVDELARIYAAMLPPRPSVQG